MESTQILFIMGVVNVLCAIFFNKKKPALRLINAFVGILCIVQSYVQI